MMVGRRSKNFDGREETNTIQQGALMHETKSNPVVMKYVIELGPVPPSRRDRRTLT